MLCRFKRLIYPKTPPAEDSGYRIVLYQPCETVRDAAGHLVEALTLKRKEISGETPAEGGTL